MELNLLFGKLYSWTAECEDTLLYILLIEKDCKCNLK